MMSVFLLTFTFFNLLMKVCVVETHRLLETSLHTSEPYSNDGQPNHLREKRESSSYALEYLVVVEVNVSELVLIKQLKSLSLQLDNFTKISTVDITTVCQITNAVYQCRCEDQYIWPCDKCMNYGQCTGTNVSSCDCITGVPNDGQFCQPFTNISNGNICPTSPLPPATESTTYMSVTLDEKFDIALTNPNSSAYSKYKTTFENATDKSFSKMAGYKPGSVRVRGFRSGSVIVDFVINTMTNELNFAAANLALSQILAESGFRVVENSFAYSVEYNFIRNPGKIYPLQDLQLNCTLQTDVMGTIQWRVQGVDPILKPIRYKLLNNNRTLKVMNVNTSDSGKYECITKTNSLNNIQWQKIVIQPFPNIQVDSDKVYTCDRLSVLLQCCAHSSYTIEWTSDFQSPLTPPGSGCIIYIYTVQKQDCEAGDKLVTFTCRLSDTRLNGFDYSLKQISLNITQKEFSCTDSLFGVGNVNQTAFRQCGGAEIGLQWAVCNKTGQWNRISNNCTLRVIQNLAVMAETLDIEEVPMYASTLSDTVEKNAENITTIPVNLLKVVDLLSKIATISEKHSVTVDKSTMLDFLKTVDVITSDTAQATWNNFNKDNTTMNTSSLLLQSIESIGRLLTNDTFSIKTSNIQLVKNLNNKINEIFSHNSTSQIDIPEMGRTFLVTVIVFSALNSVLPVRSAADKRNAEKQTSINGDVIVIEGELTINSISLFLDVKNKSLGNPQCVFWNHSLLNGIGAWDSTGCQLKTKKSERITCECNHTTSFSILMSPFVEANVTLAYITYIGVGISIGSLVLCLIIEGLVWKSMSKNDTSYMRHVSTINVALSLLIADICFIIAAAIGKQGQKTPVDPCSTLTFFVHFFYLALFFWMLLSALLLLYRIVTVFSRLSRTMMLTIAFTVGYGAPLIIAVVTVAVTAGNGGYIQEQDTCWLNWYKTKAMLAFVIPALAIVVINLLVLIIILFKILSSEISTTTQRDEKKAIILIARCVGILTPLFGLTWGFGIGTMVSTAFGIHVVFAVLNSLQGFFILVFGTLLDHKMFGTLKRRWSQRSIKSNVSESIIGGTSSNKSGYYHIFPRRYGYNVSTATSSSSSTLSSTEIFKFTDR